MAICHSIWPYRGRYHLTGTVDDRLRDLQVRLNHTFSDHTILTRALTHSSAAPANESYERLEFLGDRVLGLVLADRLFAQCPDDDEGALSLRFHAAARQSTLADVARKIDVAPHILTQAGMDVSTNDSVLADVVESLIAALFLDGGLEPVQDFVSRYWRFDLVAIAQSEKDAKSLLQELAMRQGLALPVYRLVSRSGPDHEPVMTYAVSVGDFPETEATAGSRKIAEQRAAAALLNYIASQEGDDD